MDSLILALKEQNIELSIQINMFKNDLISIKD